MPLLASLSAFGYCSGCVDCRLSPVACDTLVLSTSVERIFSISREALREKETGWLITQETLLRKKNT